jgi:hypothetical protein
MPGAGIWQGAANKPFCFKKVLKALKMLKKLIEHLPFAPLNTRSYI